MRAARFFAVSAALFLSAFQPQSVQADASSGDDVIVARVGARVITAGEVTRRIAQVAKLAGVPAPVVSRAKAVLDKLEKARAETGGLAAGLGDLPLFAASAVTEAAEIDQLRARLAATEVDALSPREALDLLYELKRLAD